MQVHGGSISPLHEGYRFKRQYDGIWLPNGRSDEVCRERGVRVGPNGVRNVPAHALSDLYNVHFAACRHISYTSPSVSQSIVSEESNPLGRFARDSFMHKYWCPLALLRHCKQRYHSATDWSKQTRNGESASRCHTN
jgi:hypothetical protein